MGQARRWIATVAATLVALSAISVPTSTAVGRDVEWAVCVVRTGNPHWSRNGQTVLFKNSVRCKGHVNDGNTIPVEVRGYLAVRTSDGFNIVATAQEHRDIPLTWEWSKPFYCPDRGTQGVRAKNRWFRGVGVVIVTRPDGMSSGQATSSSDGVRVSSS